MTEKTNSPRVGVALIGAGMIAQTHVAALSDARERMRLVAIMSRHTKKAEYLAEYYAGSCPLFTSNLSSITENPDIQVVIVGTPPGIRIELIESLARAGKNILLEKPVARNVDESVQVVEICERSGVALGVLFQHRARASSMAARRLMESGALGKVGYVEIAVPLWRPQSYYDELERGTYSRDGGGVLITQAIHTIDLALSLVGPVSHVQAMTATTPLHRMEAEDLAVVGLHFASGAVGSLVASTATFPHGQETIGVHCEHGSFRLSADALHIFWRDGRCEQDTFGAGSAGEDGPVVQKHAWHQGVIEDFVDAVQNRRAPLVSGREALASHRLIEAIESSSRSGSVADIKY